MFQIDIVQNKKIYINNLYGELSKRKLIWFGFHGLMLTQPVSLAGAEVLITKTPKSEEFYILIWNAV